MSKTSWDYFLEQKWKQEQQQFRNSIMDEVQFAIKIFKDELRQEMEQKIKQEVSFLQHSQKVEVKIDADQVAKEIQKTLRF